MSHHSKQEQLEKLFQDNYGLLVSQAISFRPRTQNELDDYIQIAAIGMMKACQNYDEEKGKFSTFAIVCIRNGLKNHVRKESRNDLIFLDNMDKFKVYIAESLDEILPSNLSMIESGILKMLLSGHTYKEIGDVYRIPVFKVKNITYNAYRKIRKANEI